MVKLTGDLFLTPETMTGPTLGTIVGEGEYIKQPAGDKTKDSLAVKVEIRGKTFRWLPNERSQSNCRAAWGDDTAAWKGRVVELWKVLRFAFGSQMEIIYGKPARSA